MTYEKRKEAYLENPSMALNTPNAEGLLLLHEAVLAGDTDFVTYGLPHFGGVILDVDTRMPDGRSPLGAAAERGDAGMVRTLIHHGAQTSLEKESKSPLMRLPARATRRSSWR